MKCRLLEIESCVITKIHTFLFRICKKLIRKHTKIYEKYIEEIEKKNEVKA